MDGPNYLRLLQTGRLDPNIPSHRKVLEENLGPLAKILSDIGLHTEVEQVKEEAPVPTAEVVEQPQEVKQKGRKKKLPQSSTPTE